MLTYLFFLNHVSDLQHLRYLAECKWAKLAFLSAWWWWN